MSDIAIRAEGIGKQYRLGDNRKTYQTLRDTLADVAGLPRKLLRRDARLARTSKRETIWALRDISFEIKSGEILGIIGHNGSGKSTLLKVLSRITEPTEGKATIRGRVGSLLEVGTGFHPELTGRENTFLNGAILGMKRGEIARKFDQIVEFAEVEKFVDTPVKHYSSGMYLRLAFAVAAHLEPEILLVDEVLAVGDMMFQRKCINKMREVARDGRTVVLVSHNLALVKDYCRSGIMLSHGKIIEQGRMLDCVARYSQEVSQQSRDDGLAGSGWTRFVASWESQEEQEVDHGSELELQGRLELTEDMESARLFCHLDSSAGEHLVQCTLNPDQMQLPLEAGAYTVNVRIPPLWLGSDVYSVYFKFVGRTATGQRVRMTTEMKLLDIVTAEGSSTSKAKARIYPPGEWTLEPRRSCEPMS